MFENLAAVLRPGGQLAFDCGGHGNIAWVHAAIETLAGDLPQVWNFATAEDTAARLTAAGFVDVDAELLPDPAVFLDDMDLRRYLETLVLPAHLDRLPADERAGFVQAVADRLPAATVDYVRLIVRARRAG